MKESTDRELIRPGLALPVRAEPEWRRAKDIAAGASVSMALSPAGRGAPGRKSSSVVKLWEDMAPVRHSSAVIDGESSHFTDALE